MKMLWGNNLFGLFVICLVMTACTENTVYHAYRSIPNEGWGKNDTLFFPIPSITDSIPVTLKLFAEVRNRVDYPYCDLHLLVIHNLPDSATWHTDTIAIPLVTSDGKWQGKGWGELRQTDVFIKSFQLSYQGDYTLKIVSGMTDETLQGINDVGIRIER